MMMEEAWIERSKKVKAEIGVLQTNWSCKGSLSFSSASFPTICTSACHFVNKPNVDDFLSCYMREEQQGEI
jgi:hypothetical protein